MEKEKPPIEREPTTEQWNTSFEKALSEFRSDPEKGSVFLAELFDSIGLELDNQKHSLLFEIGKDKLDQNTMRKFQDWGLKTDDADNISVAINPPKRESTGTHGSGERQKMIEAINTASIDYDINGNPVIKINLFGKFTGLYHKIVSGLTVQLKPEQINSITVINTSEWRERLASSANSILQPNWPDFARKQVEELMSNVE